MVCIHDQFSKAVNRDVHSKEIWNYLKGLYDMEALHENEEVNFPNEEQEFNLPPEFDKLKEEKQQESANKSSKNNTRQSLDTSIGQRTKSKSKK